MTTILAWISMAILGQALTLGTATAQSTINRDRPRSSYDPGAVGNAKKKPASVETALGNLNPQNKDYASAIDAVRVASIEETFDNYLWWMSACELFLLSLGAVYIYWLWEERESRLNISADIVAQLWNAHSGSRKKAIESIEMYNTLMRRFNAQTVELRAARAAAEEKKVKEVKKKKMERPDKLKVPQAGTDQASPVEQMMLPSALSDCLPQETPLSATSTVKILPKAPIDSQITEEEDDIQHDDSASLRQEYEQMKIENARMKQQAHAQDQKISNLRTQLNKAHDQFLGQPQQDAGR